MYLTLAQLPYYLALIEVTSNYRQQPSPLLYSIEILPARNSRLTKRETNQIIDQFGRKMSPIWKGIFRGYANKDCLINS